MHCNSLSLLPSSIPFHSLFSLSTQPNPLIPYPMKTTPVNLHLDVLPLANDSITDSINMLYSTTEGSVLYAAMGEASQAKEALDRAIADFIAASPEGKRHEAAKDSVRMLHARFRVVADMRRKLIED